MSLKVVRPLNIDFYNTKYISINAKQFDKSSRYILVSCHSNGEFFRLDKSSNYAYIRYRKADDLGVFNTCEITNDGKILVELTEQMLAVAGKCYADLVILGKDNYNNEAMLVIHDDTNSDTLGIEHPISFASDNGDGDVSILLANIENDGKISLENSSVISTMIFCINVVENAFNNTEIESSYEFNALNELLIKANSTYESVIEASREQAYNGAMLSKSYAVGDTDIRDDENIDNSKYYYLQTRNISNDIGKAFLPQGTISFAELKNVIKDTGYIYHIKDTFTTDSTFKCGSGIVCSAGTNVYYTVDGYWDYLIEKSLIISDDNTGNVKIEHAEKYAVVSDDGLGGVTIRYFFDTVSTNTTETVETLSQKLIEMERRLAEIESQNYLEIVE